jgi:hypothetical protein
MALSLHIPRLLQVQSTAQSIKSQIEADDGEPMTLGISSPPGGSMRQDKAASVWASLDSDMYRTE